jgi:hypothetical protein
MVGRRKGAKPMTSAQRQKNYRDRKRNKNERILILLAATLRHIIDLDECRTISEARIRARAVLKVYYDYEGFEGCERMKGMSVKDQLADEAGMLD